MDRWHKRLFPVDQVSMGNHGADNTADVPNGETSEQSVVKDALATAEMNPLQVVMLHRNLQWF